MPRGFIGDKVKYELQMLERCCAILCLILPESMEPYKLLHVDSCILEKDLEPFWESDLVFQNIALSCISKFKPTCGDTRAEKNVQIIVHNLSREFGLS